MKVGILFDLDGTLLDTLADLTNATNYTLRHYDVKERTMEEMRKILGSGALYQLTTAMGEKAEVLDMQEVLRYYRAYYDAHSQVETGPYPGVPEALDRLKESWPVAIVSNKPDAVVKSLCADFFPGVYALGECAERPRKPAPDMVYKAMQDLGVDACVYVGDSEIDINTAKNAGVPCLTVLWGFRDREELVAAGGQYFCERSELLPELVETVIGEVYGK